MPYITREAKSEVENNLEKSKFLSNFGSTLKTPGDLNYTITKIIHSYYRANGGKYQQINDVVGALESAKAEFQRRIVAPYEDKKIAENGDV